MRNDEVLNKIENELKLEVFKEDSQEGARFALFLDKKCVMRISVPSQVLYFLVLKPANESKWYVTPIYFRWRGGLFEVSILPLWEDEKKRLKKAIELLFGEKEPTIKKLSPKNTATGECREYCVKGCYENDPLAVRYFGTIYLDERVMMNIGNAVEEALSKIRTKKDAQKVVNAVCSALNKAVPKMAEALEEFLKKTEEAEHELESEIKSVL